MNFINDFEKTASEIAIDEGYDYVVCGHIHQPTIKKIKTNKGETTYLNSGDWIENLSAFQFQAFAHALLSFFNLFQFSSLFLLHESSILRAASIFADQLFDRCIFEKRTTLRASLRVGVHLPLQSCCLLGKSIFSWDPGKTDFSALLAD